jgi:hypothetical protein
MCRATSPIRDRNGASGGRSLIPKRGSSQPVPRSQTAKMICRKSAATNVGNE